MTTNGGTVLHISERETLPEIVPGDSDEFDPQKAYGALCEHVHDLSLAIDRLSANVAALADNCRHMCVARAEIHAATAPR